LEGAQALLKEREEFLLKCCNEQAQEAELTESKLHESYKAQIKKLKGAAGCPALLFNAIYLQHSLLTEDLMEELKAKEEALKASELQLAASDSNVGIEFFL
jgi:hypothetical protein